MPFGMAKARAASRAGERLMLFRDLARCNEPGGPHGRAESCRCESQETRGFKTGRAIPSDTADKDNSRHTTSRERFQHKNSWYRAAGRLVKYLAAVMGLENGLKLIAFAA